MANEITVNSSLQIRKGYIDYRALPASFIASMSGNKGPTPGLVLATVSGTDVDLSLLTTPGMCRIQNQDTTNSVVVGRWDPTTSRFYPFMKLLPGESYVIRLSEDIEDEYEGTGTGTGSSNTTLRIKPYNASCTVLVEAFEA